MSVGKKNFQSSSFSCLIKKSSSEKEKNSEKSSQRRKSIKRSIRLMKNRSMRTTEGVQDSHSESSIGRLSKKSSF